ncbi:hypothetical protein [Kitasatospora sp. NPDC048407]|uniref:hypothetical protein n=1 Tax=Kitasatospora sp. NPDC048407 TaxID=3364051 RepID=UPI00371E0A74
MVHLVEATAQSVTLVVDADHPRDRAEKGNEVVGGGGVQEGAQVVGDGAVGEAEP